MLRDNGNGTGPRASFWALNPLVAPAIALSIGVFFGRYLRLNLTATLGAAGLLILAAIAVRIFRFKGSSGALLVAIAVLGLARYDVSLVPPPDPLPAGTVKGLLRGKVCEQPQVSQQRNRTRVVLNDCIFKGEDGGTRRLPYRVMLSISADTGNLWPMSSLKFDESDPRCYMKPSPYCIDPKRDLNYDDTLESRVMISRPPPMRNPGGFDAREYYFQRGVMRMAYCSTESTVSVVQAHDQSLFSKAVNLLWYWRRDFRELIEDTCDPQRVPMIKALILGDRTGITTDHHDQLQRIGVAHIVTVSGLHIGFVAFFFYKILRELLLLLGLTARGTLARRLTCAGTMIPVITYVMIVPSRDSTSRAAIIVLSYLLARAIDRHREYLNTIALAAIIILIPNPGALFEPSFQLSFAAATAISLALSFVMVNIPSYWRLYSKGQMLASNEQNPSIPPLLERLFASMPSWTKRARPLAPPERSLFAKFVRRVIPTYVIGLFIVSLAASTSVAPILAVWFGRVTVIGPVANCFVIPLAAWSVNFLLLAFFALPMSGLISLCVLKLADLCTAIMELLIGAFGKVPWSSVTLSTPSLATCAAFYVALVSGFALLLWPTRRKALIAGIAAAFLFGSVLLAARWPSDLLRVAFLDVGRGFSCVIEAPGGKVAVIDGGGYGGGASEVGRNVLLPYLRCRGIAKIDYVILSNPHSERIDGLFSLLSEAGSDTLGRVEIAEVVLRDFDCQSRKYLKFRSAIGQLGLPVTEIGNLTGLKLQSFAENSLVARLAFGRFSILFLSDAGRVSQLLLSEYRDALKSTILVAPDGFETYVSSDFMELVAPQAVIVSGADQRWRKPKTPPLQSGTPGRRILRTKELHCIIVESNGREWRALTPFAELDEAAIDQGQTAD
ncbi:MAG: ComEC/Rec2 family competence protein [Candidatus Coatesbacteria bacterium]|nr:ComEC/Rec2 family competence protein [Candidatus Coatesbacteria bacterium]